MIKDQQQTDHSHFPQKERCSNPKMKAISTALFALTLTISSATAQEMFKASDSSDENLSALMMTCYVCHNPRVKSHDDIIAPPLVAVKYRYKSQYSEKEAFVDAITSFIMNPTAETALMRGPVRRFGPMPQMPMDEGMVKKIVAYIYDNEIEEPEWFSEHFKEQHGEDWQGQ